MTSSERGDRGPLDGVGACEELLENWSLAEPSEEFFAANHDAVMARIGLLTPGARATESALLEAPLPQLPGEPSALLTPAVMSSGSEFEPRAKGGSLRELAERALEGTDDAAPRSERTSAVHRAFGGHADAQDVGSADLMVALGGNVIPLHASCSAAPAATVATEAAGTVEPTVHVRSLDGARRWGAMLGALSVAAGALLWFSLERAKPTLDGAELAAQELSGQGDQLNAQKQAADLALQGARAVVGVEAAPQQPAVLDESTLAMNAPVAAERRARAVGADGVTAKAIAPSDAMDEVGATGRAGAASAQIVPEEVVLEEEAEEVAPVKANEHGESLIPDDPRLRPAAEQVPVVQQPAVGAVQGAFGQVLPSARSCVVGQTAPSRATVTFGSDGRVQSVMVVDGPAKGTPAATCIQKTLGQARVAPFAKPSFSATTTVRP